MTRIDEGVALQASLPQRQVADQASRQWQAALEQEWLRAWATPSPLVPDLRLNGTDEPAAPTIATLPKTNASQFLAVVGQVPANAPAEVPLPRESQAHAAQASTHVRPIGTGASDEVPSSLSASAYSVKLPCEPASPTVHSSAATQMKAVLQQQSDQTDGAQPTAPSLASMRHSGLAMNLGGTLLRRDYEVAPEFPSSTRSASASVATQPEWDGALRLSSPEAGKVQAALRDANLNPEGAQRVAMNLSGALSGMGFDAIRIYVNGKRYAVGKEGAALNRPTRPANPLDKPTDVSAIKE